MIFYVKDGSKLHTNMFAKRMRIGNEDLILTLFHDETRQKRLEAQFFQSQKMEAMGTMAAGIAHDFNNLLMGIQGYVSLLLSEVDVNSKFFSKLTNIENQIDKGANLTGLLLGFARRGSYDARPTDTNLLVRNNIEMFGRTNKQIDIHQDLQEDLWPSEMDCGQIDQVLINLFVNASQAMPQGGNLTVETGNQLLNRRDAERHSAEPGKYVRIRVRDDGCGMDPATREKIFEPFFTTKERGVGTGLGLASAYGIVRRHGGFITVESETGRGTTFEIYLPACEEIHRAEEEKSRQVRSGSGTILLVDDDEVVLDANLAMLEKLGYRVLAASGGEQALEMYDADGDQIDLVILDIVMPHVDGREVFRRITEIDPHQKILFSTGCAIQKELPELNQRACLGIIRKPYSMHELFEKIQELTGG
jgi:signal transduction histidine kinase/CheY-like chemotaxis protein